MAMSNLPPTHRATLLPLLLFFALGGMSALHALDFETAFGKPDAAAITGNGGLCVAVGPCGQITSCRWPSPGYCNQLSCTPAAQDKAQSNVLGAAWALRTADGRFHEAAPGQVACAAPTSTAIEVRDSFQDAPFTTRQTLFVHSSRDLLALRLDVRGETAPVRFFWRADFTPCARLLPEWPLADWACGAINDFAVFADPDRKTVYHFRPAAPRADDWQRARELVGRNAGPAEWYAFGDGVWIAYTSPNPWRAAYCGTAGEPFRQTETDSRPTQRAAVGNVQSALELEPDVQAEDQSAVLLVAFGKNRDQVDALLRDAMTAGFAQLRSETEGYWAQWLKETDTIHDANPLRQRCLLTIAQATDRQSGAIAAAPVSPSPNALDFPREGAWTTLALDLAGYPAAAERHLNFYKKLVRQQDKRGMPAGSLPAAAYTNGVEAAPHLVLETDAVAWTLGSIWQHTRLLKETARAAQLNAAWPGVEAMGRFLSHWTEGNAGVPLHSFQREFLRDRQTERSLWTTFMGVAAAANIARTLGRVQAEEWKQRQDELESLIQFRCLNDPEPVRLPPTFPFWLQGILPKTKDITWDIWQAEVEVDGQRMPLANAPFPIDALRKDTEARLLFDSSAAAMRLIAESLPNSR